MPSLTEKSLGQVAFEAAHALHPYGFLWEHNTPEQKEFWEAAAQAAVKEAFRRDLGNILYAPTPAERAVVEAARALTLIQVHLDMPNNSWGKFWNAVRLLHKKVRALEAVEALQKEHG